MGRRLATGSRTIMAAETIPIEGAVIGNTGRYPSHRRMTVIAFQRSHNMQSMFTTGNNTVMTTGTYTDHLVVIHR